MKLNIPKHLTARPKSSRLTWFLFRKRLFQATVVRIYTPLIQIYLSKTRDYTWNRIHIKVFPGVFHPGLFHTTKLLLSFLKNENLKDKSFLELGAGSGLISIYAAKEGAIVTASDISKTAINCIDLNAKINQVKINTFHSDIFESIPKQVFDYIIICPPFFKGKPIDDTSYGWFAGENYEFFDKLFSQLSNYISGDSKIFMKFSEDQDLKSIVNKASANNFSFIERFRKQIMFENQLIFQVVISLKNEVKPELDKKHSIDIV